MKRFDRWQILFDLMMAVLGVVIMAISWGYGFGTGQNPGPGLYPFFIGLALVIFGAFLLFSDLRKSDPITLFDKDAILIFLLIVVAFCLWILLMPLLGYHLVTLLTTFWFCKIMKLEGWWKPLSVSAGTTLFIYLVFDVWLYTDLSRGIWG